MNTPPPNGTAAKIAACIPLSAQLRSDNDFTADGIDARVRSAFGPAWLSPDRNPMPSFVPFPLLARAQAAAVEARARIVAAVDVLRYGAPESEDW